MASKEYWRLRDPHGRPAGTSLLSMDKLVDPIQGSSSSCALDTALQRCLAKVQHLSELCMVQPLNLHVTELREHVSVYVPEPCLA